MGLFRKAGGGGFLNGVNGVIVSNKFGRKEFTSDAGKSYEKLSLELAVQQDGADEPVQQFLDAGFIYEEQLISDDGFTLEGAQVAEGSDAGRFLQTLIESGFPEESFPADGSNFQAMNGTRVTFGKEINRERQLAAGRKKLGKVAAAKATEEQIMEAGKTVSKKDKTKSYNQDRLIVTAVLGTAAVAPKAAAKAAPKAKATAKAAPATADYSAADAFLISILTDAKDNIILKDSISSVIVRKALEDDMDNDARDSYRKLLSSEEFLSRQAGWTFSTSGKKHTVALAQ